MKVDKEELKEKYSNFIADISEILGLGKPIDILKLCQITDRFFRPLQDKVTDLEKEKCELLGIIQGKDKAIQGLQARLNAINLLTPELEKSSKLKKQQLTKAKELIKRLMHELVVSNRPYEEVELLVKDVEQFLKDSEVEK